MFALVVMSGFLKRLINSSESALFGIRMPIVFKPGFRKAGSDFLRFTIIVSAPGQYFFANFSAFLLKAPYFFAIFKSATIIDTGLLRLIFFNL